MTISIWILAAIILSLGFWFYYKKNKYKEQNPEEGKVEKKDKKSFTDIDKMLSHISVDKSTKNTFDDDEKNVFEENWGETDNIEIKEAENEIDLKEKVIGSILFEKKKKK